MDDNYVLDMTSNLKSVGGNNKWMKLLVKDPDTFLETSSKR